ncbi:hypothetical protein [Lysobacter cavernae]|uniref:hypothetical protein n=1 Tax=Lysobacter cavernae TaxID=1685901 RepID=UPI0036DA8F26
MRATSVTPTLEIHAARSASASRCCNCSARSARLRSNSSTFRSAGAGSESWTARSIARLICVASSVTSAEIRRSAAGSVSLASEARVACTSAGAKPGEARSSSTWSMTCASIDAFEIERALPFRSQRYRSVSAHHFDPSGANRMPPRSADESRSRCSAASVARAFAFRSNRPRIRSASSSVINAVCVSRLMTHSDRGLRFVPPT